MPKQTNSTLAFNRGRISTLGIARIDLPRVALSADVQTNWNSRTLGAMSPRTGSQYIDNTNGDAKAKLVSLVFSDDDYAQLEVANSALRVRIDDEKVTRPTVTSAVTNGTFLTDVSGWTDSDEVGGTSTWRTGGYLGLIGSGTAAAIRDQTIVNANPGVEHALRIVVARGPVILRVGLSTSDDSLITETTLGTGTHSLAFTPNGNFNIRVMNRRSFSSLIDSITIESAGAMEVSAPWDADDLANLRFEQSQDVIYVADGEHQQRKIERRATRSWSVVLYEPETGPFRTINTSPITMTPSALTGDITITASSAFFRTTNVGSLIRIQSTGQTVSESISAQDTFSDPIRVNGVGNQRSFGISVTGTFSATVTLQYSVGEPGTWVDVATYTTPTTESYLDELDNQIIYYRIGVKTGGFVSGPVVVGLAFTSGSITGIARVTAFTSSTVVDAVVLVDFGAITASSDWWEGRWSDRRGWPSAVTIHESRVTMCGDNIDMSISDAYEDYDDEFEGDAGPISRSIGFGPIQRIQWALSLLRLMLGTVFNSANVAAVKVAGQHPVSGRSSSFDEPLTPTNFNLKIASVSGAFIDRSRTRLIALEFDASVNDYVPDDLCLAVPDMNVGMNGLAVQSAPDQRFHVPRDDGTLGLCVRDRAENVTAWQDIELGGVIEDVSVMPARNDEGEDRVYYVVRRVIDGDTVRFIEKFAMQSECRGRPEAYLADAHVRFVSATPTLTITGLGHLEGEEIVVWGWNTDTPFEDDDGEECGRDLGTFTVSGGQITISDPDDAITHACAGLAYRARWKSAKQAFAAALGTALNQPKRIDKIGFIFKDTHKSAIRYGPTFATLYDLPLIEDGRETGEHHIWEHYDKDMTEFGGEWTTDARFCLEWNSPKPCTLLCVSTSMTTNG